MTFRKQFQTAIASGLLALVLGGCSKTEYAYRLSFDFEGWKSDLEKQGFGPELVNRFDKRFTSSEVSVFLGENITPEEVNAYDSRLDFNSISIFHRRGIEARTANRYAEVVNYNEEDIVLLERHKVPCEVSREFLKIRRENPREKSVIERPPIMKYIEREERRFSAEQIIELYSRGVKPQMISEYNEWFNKEDIMNFVRGRTGPETANKYAALNQNYGYNATRILETIKQGKTFEEAEKEAQQEPIMPLNPAWEDYMRAVFGEELTFEEFPTQIK
ncbi:MAG: hypothetical protein RL557_1051 [archaeon]|jgi:hypothetical protein